MWEKLLDAGVAAIKRDPQEKDRAQAQLERILEQRFHYCVALWEDLWLFMTKADQKEAAREDLQALHDRLDKFLESAGILVSLDCFKALVELRSELADVIAIRDDLVIPPGTAKAVKRLVPHTVEKRGKPIDMPGLLMLLREQVGSNLDSVSSTL